jgi:hypothetical protein
MTGFNSKRKIAQDRHYLEKDTQPAQEPFGHWHWEQPMTKPLQGWFVKGPSDGKLNGVTGVALYTTPPASQPPLLVQAAPEPVDNDFFKSLAKKNPSPDQRTWVGLTDEQRLAALVAVDPQTKRLPLGLKQFAEAIEQAAKEKNT